ncbi:UBX domain-containing 2B [Pelobates cultripes]|uniref:UBX domain-containing protein 2B n=1 Tax=Pelobates cultripes TaxID=61616 RepID=A0AAD1S5A6_PELCU|nr:UBX domain-containing 2B [Pelobates cultripes]
MKSLVGTEPRRQRCVTGDAWVVSCCPGSPALNMEEEEGESRSLEDEVDGGQYPAWQGQGDGEEERRRRAVQRPSVLDIQLALARLCEDGYEDRSSESDLPMSILENNQESPHERSFIGDVRIQSAGKIVSELFKEAKEHGAIPVEEANKAYEDFFKAKLFTGGAYKLGDSAVKQSEYIRDDELFERRQDVQILLKLWSNGFSLDDGELRSYTDPINAQFLESVKRGEIPGELKRMVHGCQINLDMEDHQDQEYIKPKLRFKAFSGEGQKLGSLTPEIISTPSSPEEENKTFLNIDVELDEHVPTTKIQIRLADGSRLIQRFNLSHRIMDVRNFILQSRSEFAHTEFTLVTTFPSIELTDENQTLEEANIFNTVIIQRLK